MDIHFLSLTVCLEPPFWVGVFERIERGAPDPANRVTFGAEPKDCEVWDFVLKHDCQLKFSPSIAVAIRPEAVNPKRERRMLCKQTAPAGSAQNRSRLCSSSGMHPNRSRKCSRGSSRRPKNSAVSRCGSRNERKSTGGIDLRCFFAFTLCPQFPPQRL